MDLELWHFPISHYNEKVRWALDWKGLPHRRRALSWNYLPLALRATGQASLPILRIDGTAIADSTRIIAELERRQPAPALYPADPALRRRALEVEDFCDEELGHALRAAILGPVFWSEPATAIRVLTTGMGDGARRMIGAALPLFRAFYVRRHKIRRGDEARERAKVHAAMDRIAAEIGPSGYLAGDAFSVADLTAAALLSPLVLAPELEYRPPGEVPPAIAEYRASVAAHPAFRWSEEIYRRHRGRSAEVRAA